MTIRIGEVMVKQGLLSEEQVQMILHQQEYRARPFGQLAEELFGVSEEQVELAWVEQYAQITRFVDVLQERKDPKALSLVERRQAWQFRVMPLRFDGRELMLVTTVDHLTRALRFTSRCLQHPCFLVLTEPRQLGEALIAHYPMGGMTIAHVTGSCAA